MNQLYLIKIKMLNNKGNEPQNKNVKETNELQNNNQNDIKKGNDNEVMKINVKK